MAKRNRFTRSKNVFFALCKRIDSPVSLGLWLRCKYHCYDDIAEYRIDPTNYLHATAFHRDYVAANYLRKNVTLPTTFDTKANALRSFRDAELACRETNLRLRDATQGGGISTISPKAIMFVAKGKIARVLGDLDESHWTDHCKWGPGATFSLGRREAHLHNKLTMSQLDVTFSALPYLRKAIACDVHWLRSRGLDAIGPTNLLDGEFNIVPGSRFDIVPKDAVTGRSIAVEPTGNAFLQGGVGMFIRRRLLHKANIDLSNQGINQDLARRALSEGLATVDLSAASDSIARELIYALLPIDWALLLEDLRSPSIRLDGVDGGWIDLHKHSSMGNGYTFELETLIFWALASAVMQLSEVKGPLHVYGDDIILPAACFDLLREVFSYCGFSINEKKSYATGLFYESCGKHYFNGVDVTPVYQKDGINTLAEYYRACNRLARLAFRSGSKLFLDGIYESAWRACCRIKDPSHYVPLIDNVKKFGADATNTIASDEGLALPEDDLLPNTVSCKHGTPYFPVSIVKPRTVNLTDHSSLLAFTMRFSKPLDQGLTMSRHKQLYSTTEYERLNISDVCEYILDDYEAPTPMKGRVNVPAAERTLTKVRGFPTRVGNDVSWIDTGVWPSVSALTKQASRASLRYLGLVFKN